MKKTRHLSCYLLCLLVLSSCGKLFKFGIDIAETAHIHDNGSGRFEIVVDLTKAEKFFKIEDYYAKDTPKLTQKTVHRVFQTTAQKLKRTPGIRSIATAHDTKLLHFRLSFCFDTLEALNRAMRKIYAHVDQPHLTYFKMNQQEFVRVNTQSIAQRLAYYQAQDDTYVRSFDLEAFFKDSIYKLTYSFDRKIKKATNKLTNISEDHKMVILKQHLFDEQEKGLSLSNKVVF